MGNLVKRKFVGLTDKLCMACNPILGYTSPARQIQVPRLMQNQPMSLQLFTTEKLSLEVSLN
jgi:hypothetical protein